MEHDTPQALYFDCCCEIGPRHAKDPVAPWSVDDVLRSMDRCGIDGALVGHTLSTQCDPVGARDRLAAELARAPGRLFPVWGVLPPDAGDFEQDPADFLKAMDRAGVRAVRLAPRSHGFPLDTRVLGATLEALQARRVLTLIDYAEIANGQAGVFAELDAVLRAFPDLPVVLQQTSWAMQRVVTALMERHPCLHIEFSTYQINRGLEVYVQRFGAERLLFGTGLPSKSAGAARAYVDYAQVAPEAKAAIAGENLVRLLGGLRPSEGAPAVTDPLCLAAAQGRVLPDTAVLDAHCHILPEGRQGAGAYVMYDGDADGLVGIKDVLGVRQTAIVSWDGPVSSDPESNDVVSRAVRKFPDRFLGVVYLNPTHVPAEVLLKEVRTRVEDDGFVGLKPYHKVGLDYNDDLYTPYWEYAQEHGLYALLHMTAEKVSSVACDLAARYPGVQWIIAHTGGSFAMARAVAEGMKRQPNLWAELTLTPVTNGVIEWLAAEVGDDRILFGTDAPMRDPRPQFGWVVWADVPVSVRQRILGGNFRRLLDLCTARRAEA